MIVTSLLSTSITYLRDVLSFLTAGIIVLFGSSTFNFGKNTSVSLINTDKPEKGGYLNITGLQRSTPYTFRKLYVTYISYLKLQVMNLMMILNKFQKVVIVYQSWSLSCRIFDKDSTITKMEVEDDRLNKYSASVSLINTDKPEKGGYLNITGLQRSKYFNCISGRSCWRKNSLFYINIFFFWIKFYIEL